MTDLPRGRRSAYVGIDNRAAGATAAYLIDQWLGDDQAAVLVTIAARSFRNEEEREMGFRGGMRRAGAPDARWSRSTATAWTPPSSLVLDALDADPEIGAVYSIGGGNVATSTGVRAGRAPCRVFIAHDLDQDNPRLLRGGKLSAVLHHDLRADANLAGRMIIQARGGLPGVTTAMSTIRVITPHNMP